MQLIIPQEAIPITDTNISRPDNIPRNIQRRRPIQVLPRVSIHIPNQPPDIKIRNIRPRPRIIHTGLKRRPILVNRIDGIHRLEHAVGDLRDVAAGEIFLIGEVLGLVEAAVRGVRVLRDEEQRREVEEDEVAGAAGVQRVDDVVHAVDVVGEDFARDLAVGEEGVVADVVGADPDGVDGGVGRPREEGGAVDGEEFGVGEVGGEFVAEDVWEGGVDGVQGARGDLVGADGAGDGVVVKGAVGVVGGVAGPDEAAG